MLFYLRVTPYVTQRENTFILPLYHVLIKILKLFLFDLSNYIINIAYF